jgi:transcriptional regulator with XRE-family HTH domain
MRDYMAGNEAPGGGSIVPVSVASDVGVGVGPLLRGWRRRRRLSQLTLALETGLSTRHLSFVETGRIRPGREVLLRLADRLEVPLRERNVLLLAAAYAPIYRRTALDATEMAPVRDALEQILAGNEPFPAVVIDRRWELVSANRAATAVLTEGLEPELLAPPPSILRVLLHPDGLAPRIANLPEYSAHLLDRVRQQAHASGDPDLLALHDEVRGYPGVSDEPPSIADPASLLFVPLVLRGSDGGELTFFTTRATIGTPLDITVAELAIESLCPADEATTAALRALRDGPA